MRCASCGTENAPDSRFCGGCGARVTGSQRRVAPTRKISDDAAYPPPQPAPTSQPPQRQSVPAVPQGAVNPPQAAYGGPPPQTISQPPRDGTGPARSIPPTSQPPRAKPATAEPSQVMPAASSKRWGLILLVLLLDIGLVIAGGLMLNESLSAAPAKPTSASSRTETPPATEVAERAARPAAPLTPPAPAPRPPKPVPDPQASAPGRGDAALAASGRTDVAAAVGGDGAAALTTVIKPRSKKQAAKRAAAHGVMPIDPYDDPLPAEQK